MISPDRVAFIIAGPDCRWQAAPGDLPLRPELARRAHEMLRDAGRASALVPIDGSMGHLDGLTAISGRAGRLADFLAE